MRAGRLRHRVVIQKATLAQNAYGEPVKTWATHATRWAGVEPLRGREFFAARQENAEVTTRVVLRYVAGVEPTMRVVHDSRNFYIDTILDSAERKRELTLMCTETLKDSNA